MIAASPWLATVTAPAGADMRTMPSRTAPVVRTVVYGDRLTAHGCPCGDGGEWYAVTYDGQQDGYVQAVEVGHVAIST